MVVVSERDTHIELVDGEPTIVSKYVTRRPFATDRELWERQPEESEPCWRAFVLYRDLEPQDRSLTEAYRRADGDPTWGTPTHYQRWSKEWLWRERVIAYDNYVDTKMRAALEAQRIRARVETAQLGRAMRRKAAAALQELQAIIFETVVVDGVSTKVARSALTPAQIAQLADVGVKLERLAVGDPTETSASAIYVGGQIDVNLSDEELIERAARVITARAPGALKHSKRGSAGLVGEELLHSGSAQLIDGRATAGWTDITSTASEEDIESGADES